MPTPATNRIAVFDLDGTLIDAFGDIASAINVPLRKRGLPLFDRESVHRLVGDGVRKAVERATPMLAPEEQAIALREVEEYYFEHPADEAIVYPGIFHLLEVLSDWGVRMAVLSNKPHPMTIRTCEHLGLTKYFQEIHGEDPPRMPRKPDAAGLLGIIERLGGDRAVMVGDAQPDGEVARNAGIPFVACLWGTRTREQLAPTNPVAWATQPVDLERILLEVLG